MQVHVKAFGRGPEAPVAKDGDRRRKTRGGGSHCSHRCVRVDEGTGRVEHKGEQRKIGQEGGQCRVEHLRSCSHRVTHSKKLETLQPNLQLKHSVSYSKLRDLSGFQYVAQLGVEDREGDSSRQLHVGIEEWDHLGARSGRGDDQDIFGISKNCKIEDDKKEDRCKRK